VNMKSTSVENEWSFRSKAQYLRHKLISKESQ
jgi:hypothetical protein